MTLAIITGMKRIRIGRHGAVMVDDEDYRWLRRWKWHGQAGPSRVYAVRFGRIADGPRRRKPLLMHREIASRAGMDFEYIDHADGNALNNQRANLRACTYQQNNANSCHPLGKSGYRGVQKHYHRYYAQISIKNRNTNIGCFDTAEEAAKAYDATARVLFGPFAVLNFPEPGERSARDRTPIPSGVKKDRALPEL